MGQSLLGSVEFCDDLGRKGFNVVYLMPSKTVAWLKKLLSHFNLKL